MSVPLPTSSFTPPLTITFQPHVSRLARYFRLGSGAGSRHTMLLALLLVMVNYGDLPPLRGTAEHSNEDSAGDGSGIALGTSKTYVMSKTTLPT
eukprot:929446-Pyramimonas_sp.AAC.1